MVIKGSARAGAGELAGHLLRQDTNETVEVLELHGVASLTISGALAELDGMGAGSRSKRTLYHASINTPIAEQLDPDQQRLARQRLAEELGLADQPYVVVQHVKHGRQHTHIVWSRIDVETGRAISDSHNYRKHEVVSRALEIEFGHQPVLGAHVRDKENEPRPNRGPTWGEIRQAERSGLTPQEAKRQITDLWQQTKTGTEFMAALTAEGWSLARGDRRDFVLLDQAGEVHGLTRRIEGVKAAQVRERMADVDAARFPTVDQVQARLRQAREPEAAPAPDENRRVWGDAEVAGQVSEAALRPSVEVENPTRSEKPTLEPSPVVNPAVPDPPADRAREIPRQDLRADRERDHQAEPYRPSAVLFIQIFGLLIDAYQQALDRGRELLSRKKEAPLEPEKPKLKELLKWNRSRDREGPDFDL